MKLGENPLYTMMARYLELATEVVLEPMSPFTAKNSKSAQAARNRRHADRIARPRVGHWRKRISPD